MGVKGLLQCLQKATQASSISGFKGTRVAIDASGWLHKGLYAAAEDFVDSGFNDSQFYVDFILSRARSLREAGVEPVLVFDGKRNNLKSETQAKREENRLSNIEQGRRLIDSMKTTSDSACRQKLRLEAISAFQRGLGVTHDMELNTISALRKLGIVVIVSPCEADAQLAHLCQIGYCDSVLTEDGDILVYSGICGIPFNVFYKFDRAGSVQIINLGEIKIIGENSTDTEDSSANNEIFKDGICRNNTNLKLKQKDIKNSNKSKDRMKYTNGDGNKEEKEKEKENDKDEKGFIAELKHFRGPSGRRMFAQICILAGCDYSESVHGVGLIAAQKAVIRFKNSPDNDRLEKVCAYFKSTGKNVPEEYLARTLRAELLFHYHPVYNPLSKTLENFMPHSQSALYERKGKECNSRGSQSMSQSATWSKTFASQDGISFKQYLNRNDGWAGPDISDSDLLKLGSENEILKSAPQHVTIADICEGKYSYKTFQPIPLRFPWDDPKLTRPTHTGMGPGKGAIINGSNWGTRRSLMQATASLSSAGAAGGGGERAYLVSNKMSQALPSDSWNRVNTQQFSRQQPYSQQHQKSVNGIEGAFAMSVRNSHNTSTSAGKCNGFGNDQDWSKSAHTNKINGKYPLSRSITDCGGSSSNNNHSNNHSINNTINNGGGSNASGSQPVHSMLAGSFSLSRKSMSTPPSIISPSPSPTPSLSAITPPLNSIDMTGGDDDNDVIILTPSTSTSISTSSTFTSAPSFPSSITTAVSLRPMCVAALSNPYKNSSRSSSTSTSTSSTILPTEAEWSSVVSKVTPSTGSGSGSGSGSGNDSHSGMRKNFYADSSPINKSVDINGNNNCSGIFQIPGSSSATPNTPSTPAFDFYGSQPRTERDSDSDFSNSPEVNSTSGSGSSSSSGSGNEEWMDTDSSPCSSVEKETSQFQGRGRGREERLKETYRQKDNYVDYSIPVDLKGNVRKSLENLLGVKNVPSGATVLDGCVPFQYAPLGISENENENKYGRRDANGILAQKDKLGNFGNSSAVTIVNTETEERKVGTKFQPINPFKMSVRNSESDCVIVPNDLNGNMQLSSAAECNRLDYDRVGNKENINMDNNNTHMRGNILNGSMVINKDMKIIHDSIQIQSPSSASENSLVQLPVSTVLAGSTYSSTSASIIGVHGLKRKMCDTVAITTDAKGKGTGKRVKSTMRVASIKSFFIPR